MCLSTVFGVCLLVTLFILYYDIFVLLERPIYFPLEGPVKTPTVHAATRVEYCVRLI